MCADMDSSSKPIALLIDDSCPLIHVYRFHLEDVHKHKPFTNDGRRLTDLVPNSFLNRFCEVIERRGIKGKLTILPSPGGCGDVVRGVIPPMSRRDGIKVEREEEWAKMTREWMDIVRVRLSNNFDFSPEMITHNLTLDLKTGEYIDRGEADWSQTQNRETLTPYIERALRILKEAGVKCTGVTSPWDFASKVEGEYIPSIVEAMRRVYGLTFSWYFLHLIGDKVDAKPWVAHKDGSILVSIPATVDDYCWQTIDSPRTDDEFVYSAADKIVTRTKSLLQGGGWPIWVTHWQSLWSNGLETGLKILDEAARAVDEKLNVEWMKCMELAEATYKLNLTK